MGDIICGFDTNASQWLVAAMGCDGNEDGSKAVDALEQLVNDLVDKFDGIEAE